MTIYRCTATGSADGVDQFVFGLHLQNPSGSVAAALTAFTAFVEKLWNGDGGTVVGISGYYNPHTRVDNLVATALDPITGKNVAQAQVGVSHPGFGSDQALPGEVAVCVSLRTALPTRAGRGRFYLPNPVVTIMDDGLMTDAFVLDVVSAAQYGLNSLSTAGYPAVIYHSHPKTFTPLTSVDVGNVPDSQRRRRNKLTESRQSLPLS